MIERNNTTPARRAANALLNAVGIGAALFGTYFLFETIKVVVEIVREARHSQPAGLAGPAVAIVGMFSIFAIFVFAFVAAVFLSIAGWILEPVRRWREWRLKRQMT
jgi:hypothetical protein